MMKQLLHPLSKATELGEPRPGCLGKVGGTCRLPWPCPHGARGSIMSRPHQNPPVLSALCRVSHTPPEKPHNPSLSSSSFTFSTFCPTAHFLLGQRPSFCLLPGLDTCYSVAWVSLFHPLFFLSFKEVKFT